MRQLKFYAGEMFEGFLPGRVIFSTHTREQMIKFSKDLDHARSYKILEMGLFWKKCMNIRDTMKFII